MGEHKVKVVSKGKNWEEVLSKLPSREEYDRGLVQDSSIPDIWTRKREIK